MSDTNQALQQASVRAVTGTTYSYSGDWSALFDLRSIPAGPWDQRMLEFLNDQLGDVYTSLPTAMQAFAEYQGYANWSSMGTFPATLNFFVLMEDGSNVLMEDGVAKVMME